MRPFSKRLALLAALLCCLLHMSGRSHAAQEKANRNGVRTSLLAGVDFIQSYRKQNPGLQIVDVRPESAFDRAHIPGSLHVPLGLIASTSLAEDDPLILVGSGAGPDLLLRTCRKLRRDGVQASVLWGGITRWKEAGSRLTADRDSARGLNQVSPAEYFRQRRKQYWRVLYVDEERPRGLTTVMPRAKHVPADSGLASRLDDRSDPRLLLLVTPEGDGYHRIETELKTHGIRNVFRLKGGLEAYASHVRARKNERNREEDPSRERGQCPEQAQNRASRTCSVCQ